MEVGVFYFPTDYGINIAELAQALEDRGFDSLFVPEHTHIPLSRSTPFPGGGELPKRYSHTHDPFVALAFAAAATKKLKVGTGICLVPQHDPIVTAKAIATLDQLSGGRFVFGIGAGWNDDEMENHGVRYETRFKLMREYVLAMKALWTAGRGVVPRRVREVRSGVVVAQAAAAPASADHSGRRERPYAAPRDQLLRRLVPPPARRLRRRPRGRAAASHGGREGTQSLDADDHRVRRGQRRQGAGGLREGRHPERAARRSPTTAATRSCAISTRSRRWPSSEVAA